MNNLGTITLETDRLIMRKVNMSDASQIYNNYGKDPLVSKYVVWNKHESIKVSEMLVEKWLKSYDEMGYKWVVVLKEINEVIGSITATKVDTLNKTVEIGYCFGSKWWNKGYATECLSTIIKFFFEQINAETICAYHLTCNMASGMVMKKCGMHYEGSLRNRIIDKNTNQPTNLEAYSIIKQEYFN